MVRTVQTQVVLQGAARRGIWLPRVDLRRRGAAITGWMQSGELQRRVSGGGDWLRGGGKGGGRRDRVWRAQLGVQQEPSSDRAWNERSSDRVVSASAWWMRGG